MLGFVGFWVGVAQRNVNRTESVLCWKNVGKMLGKKRTQNPTQTQQEDTFSEKATFSANCVGVWFPPGNRFLTIIKADGFFARLDFSGLFNRTVFYGTGD